MVNAQFTDKDKLQIGFDGGIKYPECCILCGDNDHQIHEIVGLDASMIEESITEKFTKFPLCNQCFDEYNQNRNRLNKIMVITFLLGLAGFISLFPLGIAEDGYNNPIILILCIVNSILIITAFICLQKKGGCFPIKFEIKSEGLMSKKRVNVFRCPNENVYERFLDASEIPLEANGDVNG